MDDVATKKLGEAIASDSISLLAARRIDSVCHQFEEDFQANGDTCDNLERHLQGFTGQERLALIMELVALDVELRSGSERSPQESDYAKLTNPQDRQAALEAFRLLQNSQAAPSPTGTLSTRYHFQHQIGQGGIGTVWRVFDRQSQRPLAIKLLHRGLSREPAAISRLLREALLTGALQHPGVPPIYDHGHLDSGVPFFAMKLVEGQTFDQILKNREQIEDGFARCLEVFEQVAQTLAYAHSHWVIHRDLKPHNIMVGQFGEVQVMDWGMAKQLEGGDLVLDSGLPEPQPEEISDAPAAHRSALQLDSKTPVTNSLTTVGDIVGTPSYMSPEQARGDVQAMGPHSDVFALGAILFEILTGGRIFHEESAADVLSRCAGGDLTYARQKLDQVPSHPELVELCRSCLNASAEERPKNAAVVADGVLKFREELSQRIRKMELEQSQAELKAREIGKRRRILATMSAVILGLTAIALAVVSWQWSETAILAKAEAQARAEAESEASAVNDINGLLNEILASAQPDRYGQDVTVRDVIDATLPELEGKLHDKPRVEGAIFSTLGDTYRGLGDLDKAEQQLRRSLAAYSRSSPPLVLKRLEVMDQLAGVLRSRDQDGDLEEAAMLRETVLGQRRELLGRTHPDTLSVQNNLALVRLDQRRFDEAQSLFEELLQIAEEQNIPDQDVGTDIVRFNLALLDWDRNHPKIAAAKLMELADRFRQNPVDVDRQLQLNTFNALGELLGELEEYQQSEEYLRLAWQGRGEYFGESHPMTLSSLRKLTRTLVAAGEFERALELLMQCVELHDESYGPDSGSTFRVREWVPRALIGLERYDEAEDYLRETYSILRDGRGQDHAYTQAALEQLDEFHEAHMKNISSP